MKTASLKPIFHGVVATALTICAPYAMEERNSKPTLRELIFVNLTPQDFVEEYEKHIVDSYLESEQSSSDSESDSESDDVRDNKRKRDSYECLNDSDTQYRLNKSQKLETYSPIMSTPYGYTNYYSISMPQQPLNIYIGAKKLKCTDTEADLRNRGLTTLPDSIENLVALTYLDLAFNKLTIIPDSIGNLAVLNELHLSMNQLTIIPDSIGNLVVLNELYLIRNQLSTLPNSIGNLVVLNELYLTRNQLSTLPNSIGNLVVLKKLELYGNQLTTLPDSIGNLGALTYLGLQNNELTTLPDSIGNLGALTELDLTGNPLMGDEQKWAKILRGAELDAFRYFYKRIELIKMNKGGLLLLANKCDTDSILTDIPKELIGYINQLHIYDRLG